MPLFWLVYRDGKSLTVFLQAASTIIHARLRLGIAGMDNDH
jgi:hypothetical protein